MVFKDKLKQLVGDELPYVWAKKAGISVSAFHRYWRKGGMPSAVNLKRICKHSGCDLNWLIGGDNGNQETK